MAANNKAVYAAIAADVVIAGAKFVAAVATSSASMMAEGVHSLIDTGNGLLLLWGRHACRKPPDETHPFGHGKALYFWTLVVALLIFTLGGCISIGQGVLRLVYPEDIESPVWNYAVLAIAAAFDGYSWWTAFRQIRGARREGNPLRAARNSKDPSDFTVFFEDSAALVGVLIAFAGVGLSHATGSSIPDGVASILIGVVLGAVAVFLASESMKLLVGERADPEIVESIHGLTDSDPDVARVGDVLTMHLGPDEVLLNLAVEFRDGISTDGLRESITRVERAIRDKHPEVKRIFMEASSLEHPHSAPSPEPAIS